MSKIIDLMIIGAQKAGTTSLKNYLSEHPEITSHPEIEFTYFNDDTEYAKGYDKIFEKSFKRTSLKDANIIVAKNVGICTSEVALQRLKLHNPACKIVFIIRNPVERAYSSYTMEISNGWLKRDFADIKQVIKKKAFDDFMFKILIELGFYAAQLKKIYQYFPKEQVQVIMFEDLKIKPGKVCSDLFELLEVNTSFEPNIKKIHNKTHQVKSSRLANFTIDLRNNDNKLKKSLKKFLPHKLFTMLGYSFLDLNKSGKVYGAIDKELRAFLIKFYKPHNEELQKLLGPNYNLASWNK